MKKRLFVFICAAVIMTLAGCSSSGGANSRINKQTTGVGDILEAGLAEEERKKAEAEDPSDVLSDIMEETEEIAKEAESEEEPEEVDIAELVKGEDGIDVDLTKLGSTLVYSEVYDMMVEPDNFIGQTIRMEGLYAVYHDEVTGKYYHACIILDATACCQSGIEFELTDAYAFPDDYPEEGGMICVKGVFDTYEEDESLYCTLRDAELEPLPE